MQKYGKFKKEVKTKIPAEILDHIHKKADNFEYKIVYQEGKDIMEIINEGSGGLICIIL